MDDDIRTPPIPQAVGYSANPEDPGAQSRPWADVLAGFGAGTLADLSRDYALFNHGALMVFGGCAVDPVRRWLAYHGHELVGPVFVLQAGQTLFDGLVHPVTGDAYWSQALVCCPRPNWKGLRGYLDAETAVSRSRKVYARPLGQTDVPLVDWAALARCEGLPGVVPTVKVDLYGVDSNLALLHFRPAVRPPFDSVRLVMSPPLAETVLLARALFSGVERPFEAIGQ